MNSTPPKPNLWTFLKRFGAFLLIFVVGTYFGFAIKYYGPVTNKNAAAKFTKVSSNERRDSSNFKENLINPLLECGDLPNLSDGVARDLKNQINQYIDEVNGPDNATRVAVYYRDLNNGPWFGINEQEPFFPGSLLKVPLMISTLNQSESDSGLLRTVIEFNGGQAPAHQYFPASHAISVGNKYTVDDLMGYMIRYSDNNATLLLNQIIGDAARSETYSDLGLESPATANYEISVNAYASFFRVLYNSTYLTHASSQKALELLAESDFNTGLVAGVPAGIKIAHKFGEREFNNNPQVQIHDCGIIYVPQKPYLLCVMTRGLKPEKLDDTIAGISKIVYENITKISSRQPGKLLGHLTKR